MRAFLLLEERRHPTFVSAFCLKEARRSGSVPSRKPGPKEIPSLDAPTTANRFGEIIGTATGPAWVARLDAPGVDRADVRRGRRARAPMGRLNRDRGRLRDPGFELRGGGLHPGSLREPDPLLR